MNNIKEWIVVFFVAIICISFAYAVFSTSSAARAEEYCPRHESGNWTTSHPRLCCERDMLRRDF